MDSDEIVWCPAPDQRHVFARRVASGDTVRVPVAVATEMWVATAPAPTASAFALFSLAVVAAGSGRMHIAFSESDVPPPPWPPWRTVDPPPAWQPCPLGQWCALPDVTQACSADLLRQHARDQRAADVEVRRGIEDRCQQIQQHGDDAAFTESLDYYTTLRVKRACQRMNGCSLRERIISVRKTADALRRVILGAPEDVARAWTVPPVSSETSAMPTQDDPNILCVPQACDYDVL